MAEQPKRLTETFYENYTKTRSNPLMEKKAQEKSKDWLNQRKMNTQRRASARNRISSDFKVNATDFPKFGEMYFYSYDAKTKEELPYWDFFPLVLPFALNKAKDGSLTFYGVNLHYLPPRHRVLILDVLAETRRGKLKVDISTFNTIVRSSEFKPAIHQYRFDHIVSSVSKIPYEEWENVINLPLADWRSASGSRPHSNKVYSDSSRRR